jgi:hypothetical protein
MPADAASSTAPKVTRRGNPNLSLAPRCGARTRSGCPCRAPAVRGRQRCRMHGGRSTGPRTAEGLARMRAARTIHGGYGAENRALSRYVRMLVRRGRVACDAVRCQDRLPPDLLIRLRSTAPELLPPPRPADSLSRAAEQMLIRAEAAALAPWKAAIAAARAAALAARAPAAAEPLATAAEIRPGLHAAPRPHAPEPAADRDASRHLATPAPQHAACHTQPGPDAGSAPRPHAPEAAADRAASRPLATPAPQRATCRTQPGPDASSAARPHAPAAACSRSTGFRRELLASTPASNLALLAGRLGWDTIVRVMPTLKLPQPQPAAALGPATSRC